MNDSEILKLWNYATPLTKNMRTLIKQAIKHHNLKRSDIKRFFLMYEIMNRIFKSRKYTLEMMITYFYHFDYDKE